MTTGRAMSARRTVVPLPLSEPDKRLSHTSGSPVRHSVGLRSTTRVQVFADVRCRPVRPDQYLSELFPGVRPALALAVEPFEHDACRAVDIVAAPFRVIRYGVVAQVAHQSSAGLPDHLPFPQYAAGFLRPRRELSQTLSQLLPAGPAFHLEVSLLRLPAIMRESQKGELLRFPAPCPRVLSGEASECQAVRLLLGESQPELIEPLAKFLTKLLRILCVLEACQKVVGVPIIVRLSPALPPHPPAEPQVQQ